MAQEGAAGATTTCAAVKRVLEMAL